MQDIRKRIATVKAGIDRISGKPATATTPTKTALKPIQGRRATEAELASRRRAIQKTLPVRGDRSMAGVKRSRQK